MDWCFENVELQDAVSTIKVLIPKEFQTLNANKLTTSNHYLLLVGFQDGSFQSLVGSFESNLAPTNLVINQRAKQHLAIYPIIHLDVNPALDHILVSF